MVSQSVDDVKRRMMAVVEEMEKLKERQAALSKEVLGSSSESELRA